MIQERFSSDFDENESESVEGHDVWMQRMLDAMPHIVWTSTAEGDQEFFNSKWYEYTGLERNDASSEGWIEILHPDDRGRAYEASRKAITNGSPYVVEYRLRGRSGKFRWFLCKASAWCDDAGNTLRWIGICTDIEAQKQAEATIENNQAWHSAILNSIPIGFVMESPSGEVLFSNRRVEEIFRHRIVQAHGSKARTEWVAYHADGRRALRRDYPLARAISTGQTIAAEEYLYERGDGTLGWVQVSAAPVKNAQGTIIAAVATISDIDTEKRAVERQLYEESRFRRVIEEATVGIAMGEADRSINYVNPFLLQLLGYTSEELTTSKTKHLEIIPPEFVQDDADAAQPVLTIGEGEPFEWEYTAKDGRRIPVLVSPSTIQDCEGEGPELAIFITDLTAVKKAEEDLVRTEKLAAASRLAASISHEINNPLAAVTNLIYLMQHEHGLSEEMKKHLSVADSELTRLSHSATHALRFYRDFTQAIPIQVTELIDSVLDYYRTRLTNGSIKVRIGLFDSQPVLTHGGELRQVLANLIANSLDAMLSQSVRKLTIRSRELTDLKTGRRGIRITVADTGSGMNAETRLRAFEPFYSTKGINGTGLGLWVTQEIVARHEGKVRFRTSQRSECHGTIFTVFLPFERRAAERRDRRSASDKS